MKKFFGFFIVAALVLSTRLGQAQPVAVSPGNDTAEATITQTCPTFSWSSVEGASAYTVAVFEMQTSQMLPYNVIQAIAAPVLSFNIGAPSLSWTPSTEECLTRGMKYVWYVRGVGKDGEEGWSEPKGFQVESSALTLEQKDAVQEVLKAYMKEEGAKTVATATNTNAQVTVTRSFDVSSGSVGAKKGAETRTAAVAGGKDVASIEISGNLAINDYDIMLRSGTDTNEGLGFYGGTKTFASANLNGPALYGCDGGALGTVCNGGPKIALQWDSAGDITVTGNINYASPETRHFSVTGAAFTPFAPGATWSLNNSVLTSTTSNFKAPVNLPDGAVVTKMTVHYLDDDLTALHFGVALYRFPMDGTNSIVATFVTSGPVAGNQTGNTTSISNGTIDNSQYAYELYVYSMDGTTAHRLSGVTIEYTVTNPLP